MPYITRFLICGFSLCILIIGTTSLQAQITKPNITLQSDTDEITLHDESPKKRPFLTNKRPHQHIINQKQRLQTNFVDTNSASSLDNTVIPPSQIDRYKSFLPISSLYNTLISPPTFQPDVQLDSLKLDPRQYLPPISLIGVIHMFNQGKLELDYVVDYLESQHHFDLTILEKLEPRRAFRYIATTSASMSSEKTTKIAKAYAERILAKDPDNPDAQLHMVHYEKDETKIIQGYKQILTQHPNHPDTLSALGYTLHEDSPEEALQFLKRANRLDPTIGLFSLGLVYEKLGDFKTAWFCFNKTVLNRKRRKARFPPSRIIECFFIDEMKLSDVEGGDQWRSEIKHIPEPNGKTHQAVRTFIAIDAQQKREIEEFYQFRDWVRNIENRKNINQNNDFLVIEVLKHLNGGKPMFDPERIVRAYEITTRHPGNDGIQLLKKTDIEVASEIERLMSEE